MSNEWDELVRLAAPVLEYLDGGKLRGFVLVFGLLTVGITIYPPFLWGARLSPDQIEALADQHRYEVRPVFISSYWLNSIPGNELAKLLPIKDRAALFARETRSFPLGWGYDASTQKSFQYYYELRRTFHVSQLLLEYFLAFWVAVFAQMFVNWRREKRNGK